MDSQALATAYGEHLYIDDVSHLLATEHSALDSQHIIDKAVDNWLMDEILLREAKNKIGKTTRISNLLEDYERSLYIQELEARQLAENLDTSLTTAELDTFYNNTKSDWILNEPIIQFLFVKVPASTYDDTMKTLWKTEDLPALRSSLMSSEENICLLEVDKWYYGSSLKNIRPSDLWKRIDLSKTETYKYTDNNSQLLLKILGNMDKGSQAPKAIAYPLIKQRILHDRSLSYLKNWRKDQYQKEIRSKDIVIYENNN